MTSLNKAIKPVKEEDFGLLRISSRDVIYSGIELRIQDMVDVVLTYQFLKMIQPTD
jgi:hypothetical protein